MLILLKKIFKNFVFFIFILLTIISFRIENVYATESKSFDEFLDYLQTDLTRSVINNEKEEVLNSVNKQIGVLSRQIFEALQKPKFGLEKLNLVFKEFCDSLNVNCPLKPWHKRKIERNLKKIKSTINDLESEDVRSFVDDEETIVNKRREIFDNVYLFADDFSLFLKNLNTGGFGTKILDTCFHRPTGVVSSSAFLLGVLVFADIVGVPYAKNLLEKIEKKNEEKRREQELKREEEERIKMYSEELAQIDREEKIAEEELNRLNGQGERLEETLEFLKEKKDQNARELEQLGQAEKILDEEIRRQKMEQNEDSSVSSEGEFNDPELGGDSSSDTDDPWNDFETNVEQSSHGSVIINNLSNEVESTIAEENGSGIEINVINEDGIEHTEQDDVLSDPERGTNLNNGYSTYGEELNDGSHILNGDYTESDGELWSKITINDLPNYEETKILRKKIEQNNKAREEYERKIQELIAEIERHNGQSYRNRQDREIILKQLQEKQKQRDRAYRKLRQIREELNEDERIIREQNIRQQQRELDRNRELERLEQEKIMQEQAREQRIREGLARVESLRQRDEDRERMIQERELKERQELDRMIEHRNYLGAIYDNLVVTRRGTKNLRNNRLDNPRSEMIYRTAENVARHRRPVNYRQIDGVQEAIEILTRRIDELKGMILEDAIEEVINDINAEE